MSYSYTDNNVLFLDVKSGNIHAFEFLFKSYYPRLLRYALRFVKDEDERRILSVHFSRPQQVTFDELEKIWHEFVLECNLSKLKLEAIYHEIILPNSQDGEIKYVMTELKDVFTKQRIDANGSTSYFSLLSVMQFPEVITQKIPRSVVKEVITRMYGEPDKSQRYYKIKREINGEVDLSAGTIDLPF